MEAPAPSPNPPDSYDPERVARRLAVARGDAPADLSLRGASIVDVFSGEIVRGDVAIMDGFIVRVGEAAEARESVDLNGRLVAPGLIDAHMHVESTMLRPSEFAALALARGVTGAIFDPHEIANVLGVEGVRWIMRDARRTPGRWRFALSSCVPASPHETSGASLSAEDLAPLFGEQGVVALAEMMNFPGLVGGDPGLLAKVRLARARGAVVDGHAPGLSGSALQAYAGAGITSDHECVTAEEALEKLRAGQMIWIREGSAARNLDALLPAVTDANWTRFGFCTDDRHPDDLAEQGHIDHVVRCAVEGGLHPARALAMASFNVARHYGLGGLGAVAPGYTGDLVVFRAPTDLRAERVYVQGELVAQDGRLTCAPTGAGEPPPRLGASVRLPEGFGAPSLRVPNPGTGEIRVIGVRTGQLLTDALVEIPKLEDGACVADSSRDLLKLAVVERHGRTPGVDGMDGVGLGFVRGFGLKRGALGSTVGHDSHNVTVVGTSDADMALAARELERMGGGLCVVEGGEVRARLALPIAGLMSAEPAARVIEDHRAVIRAAAALGAVHTDPFMPLSFLPLTVIPHLKLGDRGLVDVDRFEIVPLGV